jgi:hypothetical protein
MDRTGSKFPSLTFQTTVDSYSPIPSIVKIVAELKPEK